MLILANAWGWIVANPLKAALYLFAFLGVVFVISWFACGRGGKVKLDERQLQEAARAIEQKNDAKLKEILIEAEVKEAEIDQTVANAQAETWAVQQNAREKYANMNTSELAAELEKRK
jgi:hypothetical protein